ncbi:MAG: DUF3089 domain-containing protein [Sphingomonadaceae bacterium]
MANRFLWVVAILAMLVIGALILWRVAADDLIEMAFAPSEPFQQSAAPPAPDYAGTAAWVAHPGLPAAEDPGRWAPGGVTAAAQPTVAVFFVPPTAYLARSRWNAPLDDPETNERLDRFVKMQASVFNSIGAIWAPRYRQMTFGGFFRPPAEQAPALALAYGDVERAFDAFLAAQPADRPILLAGHSQGARHLLHLLKARRAALGDRLVAAYAVGWPVALPGDLEATGLPACNAPAEAGCLLSWQSFAADGELDRALDGFRVVPDLAGRPIGARAMLCTNPLTGGAAAAAGPDANRGTLIENRLEPRRTGARCAPSGLLLIEPNVRDIGSFVLPGGNYHAYDYSLFWANVRADAEARAAALARARPPA